MEKIRVVELFAGVGGFRLGLEQASANFQTVWANQWEPSMQAQFAFDCYERHFGHRPEHVCQNIVTAKEGIPPHDLLVGGFPCQDYSIAKKGARGIEGKKGVLWWEINAILRTHRPRYVLLENVDRLIKSPAWQKGRDFSIILRCFYEAGYAVEWRSTAQAAHLSLCLPKRYRPIPKGCGPHLCGGSEGCPPVAPAGRLLCPHLSLVWF